MFPRFGSHYSFLVSVATLLFTNSLPINAKAHVKTDGEPKVIVSKKNITRSDHSSFFETLPSTTESNSANDLIFESIARENLKTLTGLTLDSRSLEDTTKKALKKWHEMLVDNLKKHINLNHKEKRHIVFMLFSQYEKQHPFPTNTVIDQTSWQDLELLCGPKSDVSHYVAAKIDRTKIEAGKAIFFKKIIEPTNDKNILLGNQEIIRELCDNEELFNELEVEVERLQKAEGVILSLWNEDMFYDSIKQDELHVPYAPQTSKYINTSPVCVEINAYTRLASAIASNTLMVATAIALPIVGAELLTNHQFFSKIIPATKTASAKEFVNGLSTSAKFSFFGFVFFAGKWLHPKNTTTISGVEGLINGPFAGYPALFFPDYLRYMVSFRRCLQVKLMYTAQYVDALKNIALITQKCPALKKHCPTISNLENELNAMGSQSADLKQFLELLNKNTFKGKASFFSWYGRINVCYQLLHKVKTSLVHPMMVVGELDAYMSCARLMKELNEKNIPVCFPCYVPAGGGEGPFLRITDFWNPSLAGRKAITNSLTLGYQNPQNIIVTGPNAGGKSTTMKGLLVNVVLAQTFGIATASSLIFTPFSKIITYLNITDDIAAGKSHFKAGACRARELIKTVQSVSKDEYTLTAVDEVFNGTTFYEGQAAAYALIEQLSTFPQNVCVTITHFPKVPCLEQDYPSRFTNYKVTVSFGSDGSMNYPYKLERGVSQQNIALEILKIEGFNDTFLTKATQILEQNHENIR
jgi:DNA mismatch repair protein MutS